MERDHSEGSRAESHLDPERCLRNLDGDVARAIQLPLATAYVAASEEKSQAGAITSG